MKKKLHGTKGGTINYGSYDINVTLVSIGDVIESYKLIETKKTLS